jgi:hypothetical protein
MEKYITLFAGDQNDDTVTGPQLRVGRITLGDQQRLYPQCVYNHQASNSMGNRGSFPRVKRPEREANHFLPFSAEVRNGWSCILYVLIAWTEKTLAFFFTVTPFPNTHYTTSRAKYCIRLKHKHSNIIYIQQDATLHSLFYLETALHVSGGTITHHQERKQLYLQHLVFVTPLLLSAAIV